MREPPEHLLERLRRIDRNAQLVCLGQGQWALGVIKPQWASPDGNYQRRATGALIVGDQRKLQKPHWPSLRLGLLMMAGFGLLQMFELDGEPGPEILEWFARADWNWNHRTREMELEMMRKITNDTGLENTKKALADWARHEGPAVFRHVMQKRRSISASVSALKAARASSTK